MGELYIITGPPGVGKSTVSRMLASKKSKSALIDGDDIYYFVSSGVTKPWEQNNHLDVFWENVIDLIENFVERDYDVIFNYICMPADIERLKKGLQGIKTYFSILVADKEVIISRDKSRKLSHQMGERVALLLEEFKNQEFDQKFYIDTSQIKAKDVAQHLLANNKYLLNKGDFDGIFNGG